MIKLFSVESEEKWTVDLSNCKFLYPIFLSALSSLMLKRKIEIIFPNDDNIANYLATVHLIDPLLPTNIDKNFLASYANKSYLPIIMYPSTRYGNAIQQREAIEQALFDLLEQQLKAIETKVKEAVYYFISELVNNTVDHSGEDFSLIFVQHFPKKGYIDLCIVDRGKSILGSYLDHDNSLAINAAQAIEKALSGDSTKQRPNGERGYGIRTSKNMLTNGLMGSFFLWSGRGIIITASSNDRLIYLPEEFSWDGTYVFLRIPMLAPTSFIPANYYE